MAQCMAGAAIRSAHDAARWRQEVEHQLHVGVAALPQRGDGGLASSSVRPCGTAAVHLLDQRDALRR
jgi:hypothetical protein